MITLKELQTLSRDRLEDAKVLHRGGRYDWAVYTAGYAVELALKRKICETLKWNGYPSTEKEFSQLRSFKTHNLEMLLHLSGMEDQIKGEEALIEWSIISSWNPDMRYSPQKNAEEGVKLLLDMIEAMLKKL